MTRRRLDVVYGVVPPTSNKLYVRGTILTPTARKYAEEFSKFMAQHHLAAVSEMDPNAVFALHLRFYLSELVNKNWGNMNLVPSKRPKSRYKRIDLSNRIKLLEDCIRDALAIDDCQTFAASQEKHQIPPGEQERVEISIQQVEPEWFGL